jgi:hypothetical protein
MDPTEVQKQLAELMKVVQEECKKCQQAEAAQKTAEERLEATLLANPKPPTSKGPKVGVPDKFEGTRRVKAKVYANQIGLYVILNGHLFPENCSKLVFLLSYLMGLASAWVQRFTARVFAGKEVTYEQFSTAFQAMYFDTEKKSCAEKVLRALKQTRTVAHDAGWEPSTLISQYTQGLKKDIRLALVLARTEFDTLAAVTHLALKIDNKINGAEAAPGPEPAATTKDPEAMDILVFKGRLSESERLRMMHAGLCF